MERSVCNQKFRTKNMCASSWEVARVCDKCTDKVSWLSISLRFFVHLFFDVSGSVIHMNFVSGGDARAKPTIEERHVKVRWCSFFSVSTVCWNVQTSIPSLIVKTDFLLQENSKKRHWRCTESKWIGFNRLAGRDEITELSCLIFRREICDKSVGHTII
jgi:hypothetical protein